MKFVRTLVLQIESLKDENEENLKALDLSDVAEMGSVVSDVTEAVLTSADQEGAAENPED